MNEQELFFHRENIQWIFSWIILIILLVVPLVLLAIDKIKEFIKKVKNRKEKNQ